MMNFREFLKKRRAKTITSKGAKQSVHQGVEADPTVPGGCKGGDPSTWVAVPVGAHSGVQMTLCNFAVVYVNIRDQMYAFEWGHQTFDSSQHLEFGDFEQLLRTVTFGSPGPSPSG